MQVNTENSLKCLESVHFIVKAQQFMSNERFLHTEIVRFISNTFILHEI